jgi:ketosteroid isomerase-like protein
MKKLLLALLVVLSACGAGSRPEDAVTGFFNAFKNADFEKVATFMDDEDGLGRLESVKPEGRELIKTMFSGLQTTVGTSEIQGDKAVVNIKLSFVDIQAAMKNTEAEFKSVMSELMTKAGNGNKDQLQKEMINEVLSLFKKAMSAPNVQRITEDAKINLIKVDNAWKLAKDQRFGNKLFEGLDDVLRLAR